MERSEEESGMVNVEPTLVRMRSAVNTPFRILTLVVFAVLIVIIVLNSR